MDLLFFCRDGILRRDFVAYDPDAKTHVKHVVPLKAWEAAVDPHVFLKSLHAPISFEEDLTVRELFENLGPWADLMTGIACMDFPAFIDEVRAPAQQMDAELSHIELRYHLSICPVPKFAKPKREFTKEKNGLFSWNIGKPMHTGRLRTESGWDMSAILTSEGRAQYDGSESVSLSFSPLADWGHLPVRILRDAVLYDETASTHNSAFLGTRKALIRKDHPNVEATTLGNGKSGSSKIMFSAPSPTFFTTLVGGFLWDVGFDYSPARRDDTAEQVKSSAEEIKALIEGGDDAVLQDDGMEAYDAQKRAEFQMEMEMFAAAKAAAEASDIPMGQRPRSPLQEYDD